MAKDYYQTLGVSKSASAEEIRKAYYKLAHEHHPHKGGDEAKMKEINEAYGVLGTPEKRTKYDQFGANYDQAGQGGFGGFDFNQGFGGAQNVNFDMGRFGIEFVASPRHADGIVITGPITQNMVKATEICYEAVPSPKIIILFGACAISGGIFQNSEVIHRKFIEENKIDLFIPGCPPHPLTFINGLLDWLDKK